MIVRKLILLFSCLIISCEPEKIHSDNIIIKENIAFTKIGEEKLSAIVFNEYGDLGKYNEGKKTGNHSEYYQNGELKSIGNYINNKKTGEWKWYYNDGKLRYQASYIKGSLNGKHILWDQKGDDCEHLSYNFKSIYSWENEDSYFFTSQGFTLGKGSEIMQLQKCELCDKYSGTDYSFDLMPKAYRKDSIDLYIPDNKIMSLTIIYRDSVFNIEESKLIPLSDTLQFYKSSPSNVKIQINKTTNSSVIYCMDNNGKLVYPPFEANVYNESLLNPIKETYATDKVIYTNQSIFKTCINPINGENRPSYWERDNEDSKYSSNIVINLSNVDYVLRAPPEKIPVTYKKNGDGTITIIHF